MYFLFAIACAALATLLWSETVNSVWVRRFSKTICSSSFCAAGFMAVQHVTPFTLLICLGFVASLMGDVFLLFERKRMFLLGLASFLVAHVFYAASFLQFGINLQLALWVAPLLVLAGVGVIRWLWTEVSGFMKVAVCSYIGAIMAMVTLAAATEDAVLAISAIAFMVSDIAVARQRFIAPNVWNKAWGLPLYFGAQWGFVWALLAA